MSNLEQVFNALHDVILEHFKVQRGGTAGSAFVAFEFGTPIPDDTFRLNPADTSLSPELAVEFMSHHANTVPLVQDMLFTRRQTTVDRQYSLLLAGATPVSESGMELLGRVRRDADAEFNQTLGVMAGSERFHPVYATPVNWYDETEIGNWSHISIKQGDNPPAPAQPRPKMDPNLKHWWVAAEAVKPLLNSRVTSQSLRRLEVSPVVQPEAPAPHRRKAMRRAAIEDGGQVAVMRAMPAARMANFAAVSDRPAATQAMLQVATPARMTLRTQFNAGDARVLTDVVAAQPAATPAPVAVKFNSIVAANATLELATAISTDATPQEVVSDQFSIDVSMCFVELRRPWLSDGLLSLRNWYVPGFAKGSFSLGPGAPDGTVDAGTLSLLPTACILIRDLEIKAQWSDDDGDAIESSSNLGGFNLFGREFDRNNATLRVPGMQSIAWICEPMPLLPPADEPTQ